MRTALTLILINFIIAQFVAPFLMMIPCAIYLFATTQHVEQEALMAMIMIPSQLAGQIMMGIYLWKAGYISKEKATWSPVSVSYLLVSIAAILSCGFLVSSLMSLLDWIPNIMEETFSILQSDWTGILVIAISGPIFEELLFRGAITKVLLRQYSPAQAIFFSAFLFGVCHINPAQIVPAFLLGVLLAWTYYKSGSLMPCILMHIVYNSSSVYLTYKYPEVENMEDWISGTPYALVFCGTVLLFIGAIWGMNYLASKKQQ